MHFDPAGGGADRYFAGLLDGLREIGADFTAAAFGPSPAGQGTSLGPRELGLRRRWKAIGNFGRQTITPESVVATHFALYAHPLVSSLKKARHVVHFHGPWADESAREKQKPWVVAAKRFIERRAYRSAKRLIVLSTAFRDVLVRSYGIPADRIVVIPGGVDATRFQPADKVECRKKLGWPVDKKIILCVRRLVRRMGLEHLIEAFAQIAADEPDAMLVIAGKGPLQDELRALCERLGLADRVTLTGFVPDENLPPTYAAADFSIVPTQALEGFGLITLESLACGTPVLVTPIGGLPEAVGGLDKSLILSGSSIEALAAGLKRGLIQPLPSPAECRHYAETLFAWPVIARRVLAVYDSVR